MKSAKEVLPKVETIVIPKLRVNDVVAYGTVYSRVDDAKYVVVLRENAASSCICADQIYRQPKSGCDHIRALRLKYNQRMARRRAA